MRALAITGIDDRRHDLADLADAAPCAPRRLLCGYRTARAPAPSPPHAPAFSAITACSALVTSMMTPPFSISARPTFSRNCSLENETSFRSPSTRFTHSAERGMLTPSPAPARSCCDAASSSARENSPQNREALAGSRSGARPAKLSRSAPASRPRHREIPARQIGHAFLLRARQQAAPHPAAPAAAPTRSCRPAAASSACPPARYSRQASSVARSRSRAGLAACARGARASRPDSANRSSTACES